MYLITVGVVGIGYGRQVLVPAFRSVPCCTVGAICASSEGRARKAASELDIPNAYGDWRGIVRDPELDIVVVAAPPMLQPEIVLAALERGKHVFCEKPVALDAKTADALLAAAHKAGMQHAVDFEFSEISEWRRAKEVVPELGALCGASVSWKGETYVYREGLRSWKKKSAVGGGTLNLFGSHTFYYVEWLLGPIRSLSARLKSEGKNADPEGDTSAELDLKLASGAEVSVELCSNDPEGKGHRIEVEGENGSLVLENAEKDYVDGFTLRVKMKGKERLESLFVKGSAGMSDGRIAATGSLARGFVARINGGMGAGPTLEHGCRVQRLLDAARSSSETGHEASVG